jgi:DNA invertase Pin-like site-specific DNA recombinase
MTRAALYLRVSTDMQTTENQRPDLLKIASTRGLEIVEEYVETESAAKVRPIFERMMADARGRRFDALLIWSISRFGRNMLENLGNVLALDEIGVLVISHRDTWLDCTSGITRKMLIGMQSAMAEHEMDELKARTRAGIARARVQGTKSGKPIGRPRKVATEDVVRAIAMMAGAKTLREVAVALKIKRSTLQRALAEYRLAQNPPSKDRAPGPGKDALDPPLVSPANKGPV